MPALASQALNTNSELPVVVDEAAVIIAFADIEDAAKTTAATNVFNLIFMPFTPKNKKM